MHVHTGYDRSIGLMSEALVVPATLGDVCWLWFGQHGGCFLQACDSCHAHVAASSWCWQRGMLVDPAVDMGVAGLVLKSI